MDGRRQSNQKSPRIAAQGNGGAITMQDAAVVTVSHSPFDGNQARGGDGSAGGGD